MHHRCVNILLNLAATAHPRSRRSHSSRAKLAYARTLIIKRVMKVKNEDDGVMVCM